MARIGFLGLGNMGGPMAANLVAAGHAVAGYDPVPEACARAAEAGVTPVTAARDAAAGADLVITMLPAGADVLAAYGSGLLEALPPGALVVDCSTIDVAAAREAHALAGARGLLSVDAPVSGGVAGAAAASLTFMAGGETAALDAAEPVLASMGRRIVRCGGPGAGQAAKLCNNMILGISMIAISEAFVLGESLGLTHQALFDVASTASGQCWALVNHCPVPGPVPASAANRDYQPGFAAALMAKDLTLARRAAEASGVAAVLGSRAQDLYADFVAAGHGGRDYAAIITAVRAAGKGKP